MEEQAKIVGEQEYIKPYVEFMGAKDAYEENMKKLE